MDNNTEVTEVTEKKDKYIGTVLAKRYGILEQIGEGGMARVYKAIDNRLNRFVAVKILKDEYMQDEELKRRFASESHAVAMLSHPNIVSVFDVSHDDDLEYIVMELVDGITLKQYLSRKTASPGRRQCTLRSRSRRLFLTRTRGALSTAT